MASQAESFPSGIAGWGFDVVFQTGPIPDFSFIISFPCFGVVLRTARSIHTLVKVDSEI